MSLARMAHLVLFICAVAATSSAELPGHEPLQPVRGIDGVFWGVIVPGLVLIVSISSTVALYLHFSRQGAGASRR